MKCLIWVNPLHYHARQSGLMQVYWLPLFRSYLILCDSMLGIAWFGQCSVVMYERSVVTCYCNAKLYNQTCVPSPTVMGQSQLADTPNRLIIIKSKRFTLQIMSKQSINRYRKDTIHADRTSEFSPTKWANAWMDRLMGRQTSILEFENQQRQHTDQVCTNIWKCSAMCKQTWFTTH